MSEPIGRASRVSVNSDVVFRDLDGEMVLLNLRTGVYFSLDALGTRIWSLAQAGRSLEEIVAAVIEEYEVTAERFADDLLTYISELRDKGLVAVEA